MHHVVAGGGELGGSPVAILPAERRGLRTSGRASLVLARIPRSSPLLPGSRGRSPRPAAGSLGGRGGGVSARARALQPLAGGARSARPWRRGGAAGRGLLGPRGRRAAVLAAVPAAVEARSGAASSALPVAMYRSGSRSSVSSHRPKDGGASGPPPGRPVGASSGPARRPSSPPPSCSSLRLPARRHRSPSGHRGRWASPSPPRGRRGSPSPPRGRRASPSPPRGRRASPSPPRGRRVSPSPPRARRGSPSPPRSRRHYPPGLGGFRGSIRGESRADFARDGRGDHPGDSGSRVIPPFAHVAPRSPPPGPSRQSPNVRVYPASRQPWAPCLHNNGFGTRSVTGLEQNARFFGKSFRSCYVEKLKARGISSILTGALAFPLGLVKFIPLRPEFSKASEMPAGQ